MKKRNIITAVIALLLSAVSNNAFAYDIAVENDEGITIYYNYINDGRELEVTYKSNNIWGAINSSDYSGTVVIPEEVTYTNRTSKVTAIGNYAFWYCSTLTSVTIPNSVTTIGHQAFEGCSCLTSITIPSSVTTIGDEAFSGCSGLTSMIVEENNPVYDSRDNSNAIITTSNNTLLSGCKNTIIPNSVTAIGNYAFYGCSGLTSITIPNSVITIGNSAFSGCSGLTSITIPSSVTTIGDEAFFGTTWFNSQPDGLVYVGKFAYKYKGKMPQGMSIEIDEGTLGIVGGAFFGYSGLTTITIPNSVTTIGDRAFENCSGLTSVTIPNSVTSIGDLAFSNCI